MNSIKFKYIVFAFLLVIVGCRKDEMTEGPDIMPPSNDPTIEVVSGITALVTNEDGDPISNASVTVYNKQITTDENGIFNINNQALKKSNTNIRVEKTGYFDGFKSFIPAIGQKSFIRLILISKGSATKVPSSEGGVVDILGGAELNLPANGVVVRDGGATYNGDINVFTHWYDPTDPDLGLTMPGNLLGITSDEMEVQLGTYGMIAVELESPNGVKLQLKENAKATLKFPVPNTLEPPSTIPLWSLDESDVVWKQEGEAILVDGFYEAEVSHFSFWNCDAPFPLVNIEGRILYNGSPVTNMPITITANNLVSGYGYTDSEGFFRGKVPRGRNLLMTAGYCDETVLSHNLGVLEQDVDLGDIEVDIQNFVTEIKGRMIGCLNTPLQSAYGLLKLGDKIIQVITPIANDTELDGTFSIVVSGCPSDIYTVQFFDPENIKNTGIITISPDIEINDLQDVRICDNPLEFIQYSVNGELAQTINDAEVYFSNDEKIIIRGALSGSFESFDMDVFASVPGDYNPSSMSIQSSTGPVHPELLMMCGDHISNLHTCDQFEVSIEHFSDYVAGTFSGTLVSFRDSLSGAPLDFYEYYIEGSFSVKIDENITTGEISGQFWFDENDNNTREDDEDRSMTLQYINLRQLSGSSLNLFPRSFASYDRFYKFTDLLPGTYQVVSYNYSGYELVVKDVGSEDRDSDFSEISNNSFATDELEISTNEIIENVDLGFKLPNSIQCGNLYYLGCTPNITLSTGIGGGVPPYLVTLNGGPAIEVNQNVFLDVIVGGIYILDITDQVGNTCTITQSVPDYTNRIQGLVWRDVEGGTPNVYDLGDFRMDEVTIFLMKEDGSSAGGTQTDSEGLYTLENIPPGAYYIEIDVPSGLQFVDKSTGGPGSNINPETNRSDVFQIDECDSVINIDAGLKPI